jgi:hypothetical protein
LAAILAEDSGMPDGQKQLVSSRQVLKVVPWWGRILIGLGTVVAIGIAYLWLFGTQTFLALETRSAARKLPFIRLTPVALTDLSISMAPGMKLSYVGYEFEVPWTDLDETRSKVVGGNKAIIVFRSGNVLSVWSGPPHELRDGLLKEWKMDRETLVRVFGPESVDSDYDFVRTILEATPQSVSVFGSRRRAVSQGMLLMIKAICVPGDPDSGIFAVRGEEFRGFQYGRPPQRPPKRLNVELFPENAHIELMFGQKPNGPVTITQPDVSRVVQTIRAAPATQATVAQPSSSTDFHN